MHCCFFDTYTWAVMGWLYTGKRSPPAPGNTADVIVVVVVEGTGDLNRIKCFTCTVGRLLVTVFGYGVACYVKWKAGSLCAVRLYGACLFGCRLWLWRSWWHYAGGIEEPHRHKWHRLLIIDSGGDRDSWLHDAARLLPGGRQSLKSYFRHTKSLGLWFGMGKAT